MWTASDHQHFNDEANRLTLRTSTDLLADLERLSNQYDANVGLTIVLDAALSSAVAMVRSAIIATNTSLPIEQVIRGRLEHVFSLPVRLHERLADGSVDPLGSALN